MEQHLPESTNHIDSVYFIDYFTKSCMGLAEHALAELGFHGVFANQGIRIRLVSLSADAGSRLRTFFDFVRAPASEAAPSDEGLFA